MADNRPWRRKAYWRTTLALLAAMATVLPSLGAHGAVLQGACVTVYPGGPGAHVDPRCRPVGMGEHVRPTSPFVSDAWNPSVNEGDRKLIGIPIHHARDGLGGSPANATVDAPIPEPAAVTGEPGTPIRSTVASLIDVELPDDREHRLEVS